MVRDQETRDIYSYYLVDGYKTDDERFLSACLLSSFLSTWCVLSLLFTGCLAL